MKCLDVIHSIYEIGKMRRVELNRSSAALIKKFFLLFSDGNFSFQQFSMFADFFQLVIYIPAEFYTYSLSFLPPQK